ncbi:hypothetical protein BDZ89DRAFT_478307 [Hymenopellis radicata]|nr:hypothetical protein BDZ89DRAFT_478307 [Hymenopellis radicata]
MGPFCGEGESDERLRDASRKRKEGRQSPRPICRGRPLALPPRSAGHPLASSHLVTIYFCSPVSRFSTMRDRLKAMSGQPVAGWPHAHKQMPYITRGILTWESGGRQLEALASRFRELSCSNYFKRRTGHACSAPRTKISMNKKVYASLTCSNLADETTFEGESPRRTALLKQFEEYERELDLTAQNFQRALLCRT